MFSSITVFFSRHLELSGGKSEEDTLEHALRVATASLLIEMTRADFEVKAEELLAVDNALRKCFGLTDTELGELVQLAEEETRQASCLYEFTRLIDKNYSLDDKRRILELLWQVAFADGELEKYEEHLIRKIVDLLHLTHSDFIRAKHRVMEQ